MEAYISQIQYYCTHDGPGIRTTVFFMGCPMRCVWCHNPECSIYAELCKNENAKLGGKIHTVQEVFDQIKVDQVFYGSEGGITCSGGEPLLHQEFVKELFLQCREYHIHTAIETSLCVNPDTLQSLLPLVDLWIVDIKCINPEKHYIYTGVYNYEIYKNLQFVLQNAKSIWIRMPIIPGAQTKEDIQGLISWIKDAKSVKKIELIPFHLLGREKYEKLEMPCPYPSNVEPDKEWMDVLNQMINTL